MKKNGSKKTAFDYIKCARQEKIERILLSLQQTIERSDKRYHESLYNCLSVALELRLRINDEENWRILCSDPCWEKNRKAVKNRPKRSGASDWEKSYYLTVLAFAGPQEARIDRASKYAHVIHHYYEVSLVPNRLPAELRKIGGIDKLVSLLSKEKVSLDSGMEKDCVAASDSGDAAQEAVKSPEKTDKTASEDEKQGGEQTQAETAQKEKSKKLPQLVIDVTDEQLLQALEGTGKRHILIHAIREESEKGWKPITAGFISVTAGGFVGVT
ncbi:hypothetical protein [Methylobacterium sp. Leaf111]|uniref:hypothetical protein n=1 Tax=Methylobacterium sp. Leaf111 TaxID=1736257 RepID=UPI000A7F62BE|nr:hypothetical protein [Methylobacterium sp. Leaf111]